MRARPGAKLQAKWNKRLPGKAVPMQQPRLQAQQSWQAGNTIHFVAKKCDKKKCSTWTRKRVQHSRPAQKHPAPGQAEAVHVLGLKICPAIGSVGANCPQYCRQCAKTQYKRSRAIWTRVHYGLVAVAVRMAPAKCAAVAVLTATHSGSPWRDHTRVVGTPHAPVSTIKALCCAPNSVPNSKRYMKTKSVRWVPCDWPG